MTRREIRVRVDTMAFFAAYIRIKHGSDTSAIVLKTINHVYRCFEIIFKLKAIKPETIDLAAPLRCISCKSMFVRACSRAPLVSLPKVD